MEDVLPTAEQIAAWADAQIVQITDPEGFAIEQQRQAILAQYEALVPLADEATLGKLAIIRDAQLAALLPPAAVPVPQLTVDALPVPATTVTTKAAWSATQVVEPERDGQPWCTWEDAEEMLVRAAKVAGVATKGYRLKRDDKAMTLTLDLV